MRQEAARRGGEAHQRKAVAVDALEALLRWIRPDLEEGGEAGVSREGGDWVEAVCTWRRFKAALAKAEPDTAVGEDGFSAYLLKRAPEEVQRSYYEALKVVIRERAYPEEWLERVAMPTGCCPVRAAPS